MTSMISRNSKAVGDARVGRAHRAHGLRDLQEGRIAEPVRPHYDRAGVLFVASDP
jgi:hypothetical protein